MIIDDDKLEILVQKVLSDERERIYNSWFCEGDIVTPILEIKQTNDWNILMRYKIKKFQ